MLPPFAVCLVIGLVLWAAWKDPRVPLAGRLVWWARQWGYEIIGAIVALAVIGPVVTFLLVSTFIALWRLPDDPRTWAGVQRWRTAPTRAKRISGTAAYVALTTHANLVQRVRRNHVRRTWRRSMRHCGVSGTRVRELERTPPDGASSCSSAPATAVWTCVATPAGSHRRSGLARSASPGSPRTRARPTLSGSCA
jgi:hypothetical protein